MWDEIVKDQSSAKEMSALYFKGKEHWWNNWCRRVRWRWGMMNYSGYQVFSCFSMYWKSVVRWNPDEPPKTATLHSSLGLVEEGKGQEQTYNLKRFWVCFHFLPSASSGFCLPCCTFLIFFCINMSHNIYTRKIITKQCLCNKHPLNYCIKVSF